MIIMPDWKVVVKTILCHFEGKKAFDLEETCLYSHLHLYLHIWTLIDST